MACFNTCWFRQGLVFSIALLGMFYLSSCGSSGTEPVNHNPNAPYNPAPANGAVSVELDAFLNWTCTDPDGDALVYSVYFGVESNPEQVSSGQSASSYVPDDPLTYGTTYYWKIRAKDSQDGVATGPLWSFETIVQSNPQAPTIPANPSPADDATFVETSPTLAWTCSDPNGDDITYDIYFGSSNDPPLIAEGITAPIYDLLGLSASQQYYWKIVATDITSLSTAGPVWSFTTASLSSNQIASFGSLPRWSPDSQKLVFGAEGVNEGLWVYDRSSESLTQITDGDNPHLFDYRWSPNSDSIAYGGAGSLADLKSGIFTVALNGSDPVRIHDTGHSPCWNPDGSGLVFVEEDASGGNFGLYRLTFASGSTFPLNGGSDGIDPQFNGQGTQIAFRLPGTASDHFLNVIPAGGGSATTLTDVCESFVWTSDGSAIVFDYFTLSGGGTHIASVSSAGGSPTDLPIAPYGSTQPTISSGNLISFQRLNGDTGDGIWTITLAGTSLTNRASSGAYPSISPDGSIIAYARADGIYLVQI